jgi:hypothetical protein
MLFGLMRFHEISFWDFMLLLHEFLMRFPYASSCFSLHNLLMRLADEISCFLAVTRLSYEISWFSVLMRFPNKFSCFFGPQ